MILAGVLRGRWRLMRASLRPSRDGRRGGGWRDLVIVTLFATLSWLAVDRVFTRLLLEHTRAADAARVLGLALTVALLGLAIFDLHQGVSALVLDSDLALLRAAPLGPRALALLKLLDAVPGTALLTVMLVLPSLAGFARAYPLPAWCWLLLPPAVLTLWLAPMALGMSVALPLVRALPARRARETLAVFASASLALLWVLQAFVLPRVSEPASGFTGPLLRLARAWDALGGALPSFWLARALGAAAGGAAGHAAGMIGAFVALAALGLGSLALYLLIASRTLESVLESLGPAGGARRRGRRLVTGMKPASGAIRALLTRDARLIRRDWAVLADVVAACVLWLMIPLATLPFDRGFTPLAGPMLVALAVGLGYEVAARSAPFERGGLAWVKLAPLAPRRWLLAKLAGVALFSLPILGVALVAVAITLRPPAAALAGIVLATLSALASSLALGLWTGLRHGDPGWVNPRAMLVMRGRLLAAVGLVAQVILWVALMWFATPPAGPAHPWVWLVIPALGLALAWLGVALAQRVLDRFEPAT